MRPSSGARFYVACAKGPAELGRRLPTCPGPRRERRGFSLGPLSTSSAAVRACSGDVAIAQIADIRNRVAHGSNRSEAIVRQSACGRLVSAEIALDEKARLPPPLCYSV